MTTKSPEKPRQSYLESSTSVDDLSSELTSDIDDIEDDEGNSSPSPWDTIDKVLQYAENIEKQANAKNGK